MLRVRGTVGGRAAGSGSGQPIPQSGNLWGHLGARRLAKQHARMAFVQKVQSFKKIRMLGAAAVMGAFVADGRIDAYTEEQIMLWDVAASSAIVRAAGGVAEVIPLEEGKCICRLFANQALYDEYMENMA